MKSTPRSRRKRPFSLEKFIVSLRVCGDDLVPLRKHYDVDLFCWLSLEQSNQGFRLSASLARMLSRRGVEIGFDIYAAKAR